jgi:hypothetical protein
MHSALYHFAVQKNASRQFVTVSGASHAPLTSSLRTCADDIWNAILNQKTLGRELNGCPRQSSLTVKQAGQE